MKPSATSRMRKPQLCQPEAMSPPAKVCFAASSSVWKGCASNSRAKATISSAVTAIEPGTSAVPGEKSSKW
jgi:hypothetical protein